MAFDELLIEICLFDAEGKAGFATFSSRIRLLCLLCNHLKQQGSKLLNSSLTNPRYLTQRSLAARKWPADFRPSPSRRQACNAHQPSRNPGDRCFAVGQNSSEAFYFSSGRSLPAGLFAGGTVGFEAATPVDGSGKGRGRVGEGGSRDSCEGRSCRGKGLARGGESQRSHLTRSPWLMVRIDPDPANRRWR